MDENAPPPLNAPPASPLTPPPVIVPGAPTPPSRAGRGWMVFAFVLLALLALSALYNLAGFARSMLHGGATRYSSRTAGPRLEEVITEDNSSAGNKIAVVEVDGIITSRSIDQSGFTLPSSAESNDRWTANAFAALLELNHFSSDRTRYRQQFPGRSGVWEAAPGTRHW